MIDCAGQTDGLTWAYDERSRSLELAGLTAIESMQALEVFARLPPRPTVEQIDAATEEVRATEDLASMVKELRSQMKVPGGRVRAVRRPIDPSKELLSLREASRLLGCDRRTTLQRLLREGVLVGVPGARGVRIQREQVEALVMSGIPPPGSRRLPPRKRRCRLPPAADVAAAILKIPIR